MCAVTELQSNPPLYVLSSSRTSILCPSTCFALLLKPWEGCIHSNEMSQCACMSLPGAKPGLSPSGVTKRFTISFKCMLKTTIVCRMRKQLSCSAWYGSHRLQTYCMVSPSSRCAFSSLQVYCFTAPILFSFPTAQVSKLAQCQLTQALEQCAATCGM